MNINRRQKQAIVLVLFIVLFLLAYTIYSNSKFRIVSSSLNGSDLPTSTSEVVYTFNKDLKPSDKQLEGFLSLPDNVNYQTVTEGPKLRIILTSPLEADSVVAVNIASIESLSSDQFSAEFKYTVKYIPFSKLTKEEQLRQINESSLSNDGHPLLVQLPHDEITFRVESIIDESSYGQEEDWRQEKDNYAVIVSTFALKSGVADIVYRNKTLGIREDALESIEKSGVDNLSDINILYIPSDADLDGLDTDIGD